MVFRYIPSGRLVRIKRTLASWDQPSLEIFFADGTAGIVPRHTLDARFSDEQRAEFERECVADAKF
jgi:hypothetical protein